MPDIQPQNDDDYYCKVFRLEDQPYYIQEFIPHAEKSFAHHMLLYTCETPGQIEGYWKCGSMNGNQPQCHSKGKIIYAWGLNAKELVLSDDISFKVGKGTDAQYLVLNVHYKDVSKFHGDNAAKDQSGFTLKYTMEPTLKSAGIALLGSGGILLPNSRSTQRTACQITQDTVMHPFAFLTHTHKHGIKVAGYRIHYGKWTLIGEMDPQKEQFFYDVKNQSDVIVRQNDYLAAQCLYENNENRTVVTGSTHNDEMCNFYMMYYVEGDNNFLDVGECFNNFDWSKFFNGLDILIPDKVLHPFD